MVTLIFYLAALGTMVSLSLLLPILVAFGYQEFDVGARLTIYAFMGVFLSASTLLAIRGFVGALDRIAGIYMAVLAWIGIPLLLAIPFADILGLSYRDAVFETISGFTTTGATQFSSIEILPKSMIVARSQLQWLGGLATLFTFILIVAPSKIGGLPQQGRSSVANAMFVNTASLIGFCWRLTQLYLLLSFGCFVLLLITGSEPFDALVLAMTAVSSGGFLPNDRSLGESMGSGGMLIMALFFIIAATSVFWHQMILRLRINELKIHRESYFIIGIWLLLAIAFSYAIFRASGALPNSLISAQMAEGLFNAASLISTAGLQSRPGIYALLPATLVLAILVVGAGSFSTSSGIKFFRVGGMFRQAVHEINLLIYPHGIRPRHFGSIVYDIQMMKAIWAVFIAAIVIIIIGAIMLTYYGMNFQAGFTASIAAFVNAGPAYGPEWAPQSERGWPAYFDMIPQQKWILCGLMILGRLEVILAMAAANVMFWINR